MIILQRFCLEMSCGYRDVKSLLYVLFWHGDVGEPYDNLEF